MERYVPPGHEALVVLRDLVSLYDQHFFARQYVKASGRGDIAQLELRARRALASSSVLEMRALTSRASLVGSPAGYDSYGRRLARVVCLDCHGIHFEQVSP